ncbi:hypothetical protein BH10PAT1_BH10PAT1_7490 [soil metagenome]
MFHVYILISEKDKGIYIGKTNNVKRRFTEHNAGQVSSTKSRRPFKLLKIFNCSSEKEALDLEKEYKKGFRREEIKREFGL